MLDTETRHLLSRAASALVAEHPEQISTIYIARVLAVWGSWDWVGDNVLYLHRPNRGVVAADGDEWTCWTCTSLWCEHAWLARIVVRARDVGQPELTGC